MAVTHTDKNTPDHAGSMVRGDFDFHWAKKARSSSSVQAALP